MHSLKDRLAHAMNLRGIEVADLVRKAKISKSGIHFILNGTTKAETIRAVSIDKLAHALAKSRDWLLYGYGTPDTPGQATGPALTSLAEAVELMRVDEAMGGNYPPEQHAALLLNLSSRLAAGEHPQKLASWLAYQRGKGSSF